MLFSAEGTRSAGAVLSGRGVIEASAEVSTTASGEGSGVLEYSGDATGHAPGRSGGDEVARQGEGVRTDRDEAR